MKHDLFMNRHRHEQSCKRAAITLSWIHGLMIYHELQACMLYHEIHGISNAWKMMKIMEMYGLHELSWQIRNKTAGSKNEQGNLHNLHDCRGGTRPWQRKMRPRARDAAPPPAAAQNNMWTNTQGQHTGDREIIRWRCALELQPRLQRMHMRIFVESLTWSWQLQY